LKVGIARGVEIGAQRAHLLDEGVRANVQGKELRCARPDHPEPASLFTDEVEQQRFVLGERPLDLAQRDRGGTCQEHVLWKARLQRAVADVQVSANGAVGLQPLDRLVGGGFGGGAAHRVSFEPCPKDFGLALKVLSSANQSGQGVIAFGQPCLHLQNGPGAFGVGDQLGGFEVEPDGSGDGVARRGR